MAIMEPRTGMTGVWDRLVGPGMSVGENALTIGSSAVGGVAVAAHLSAIGFAWPLVLLGALVAVDVVGGAVCNMTETTKRWYHRPGRTPRDHFAFISVHILHVVIVAWAFRGDGFDVVYALTIGTWLLVSASAVLVAPSTLRSPLATTFYAAGLGISLFALGPTPGLDWFVPLLFVKLLIGHAVPLRV